MNYIQAREIIMSGALGRILSTSVVGYDSSLNRLPGKAIIFQDPANGRYASGVVTSGEHVTFVYYNCTTATPN